MTRKEIIDALKFTMDFILLNPITCESVAPDALNKLDRITYDACKGAVELLESQKTQLSKEDATFDCISRRAAIDGLSKLRPRMINTHEKDGDIFLKVRACDVKDMLEGLPPAQPEIIRCKDCRFADGEATTSNGMYWCMVHRTFMRYCSDAER